MALIRSFDGGEFSAYLSLPASGRGPGVVVLQEIFGVTSNLRSVCDWLSERGFVAICPDLFWRIEPNVALDYSQRDRALDLFSKLDVDKAVEDSAATMEFLRTHPACTGRVGAVGHCLGGRLAYLLSVRHKPQAAVSYYGVYIEKSLDEAKNLTCPLMLHVAAQDKYSPPEVQAQFQSTLSNQTIYIYPSSDHAFARKGGEHYDPQASELANLRTLDFFVRHLVVNPHSLEAIWAKHIEHEFATRSTDETLATMVEDAYVNHVPTITGGSGKTQLREFYSKHFIPQMPPDTSLTPISRTVGDNQIVDEMIFQFTHTIRMDWMLPGIEPTGRRVEVPLVAIVKMRGDKLAHEHIYWDQASVLVQLGLLNGAGLPVAGIESSLKVQDSKRPSRKLP